MSRLTLGLFARRRRRVIVAIYPDGVRHEFRRIPGGDWEYHPSGSAAFPLSVAKAEARYEGATIKTEYR